MPVRSTWLAALGALLPAAAAAQTIRGTVSLRAEGRPVAGVVVLMLDSAGAATTRALTNERGEFAVTAASAGVYRVRTLRIGYRPEMSDPIRLAAGQVAELPIALASVPVSLDTIRIAGRNSCRVAADEAQATHIVWEQARAAFAAAQLTSTDQSLEATLMTYERTLDPTLPRVWKQSSAFHNALSAKLWGSASVDSLRRFGYVVSDLRGSRVFRAPDLNVLLSDTFREDHCFRLARGSGDESVGIEFEPVREREGVAEIGGTVQLRRATAELQSMDFHYVGLSSAEMNAHPGGGMQFLRLPSGEWAVASWNIRMPVLEQVSDRVSALSLASRTVARVLEIRVAGGELVALSRNERVLWTRPALALRALVRDSVLPRPIAGATLSLRGTQLTGTTNRSGEVTINGVLPGDYTVDIRTPTLDSLGATHTTSLNFTGGGGGHELRVPDGTRVAAEYCGFKAPAASSQGLALGVVRIRGDSTPPWNVSVVAEWGSGAALTSADARTDAFGRYRICGVPVDAAFTIRTELDDTVTAPRPRRFERSARYAVTDVMIEPPKGATGTMFTGAVMTLFGREPLREVEVALPDLGISVRTNEHGRFRIGGITPGTHRVAIRRIGYGAIEERVTFAANRPTLRQFRLVQVASLEAVTVVADRRMASFEENRRLGFGKFVTREELAKAEFRPLAGLITMLGGADVVAGGRASYLRTRRVPRWYPGQPPPPANSDNLYCAGDAGCQCWSQVWVDRMLVNPGRPTPPFNLNDWMPHEIEAIEFYPSAAGLPMEYQHRGATCGTFVIHMRKGK